MTLHAGCNFDVSQTFHRWGADGILVGNNREGLKGVDPDRGVIWIPGKGGHALSFGMTGSGKGLQIIGALTQYCGNTLTIDPVGANAWATAQRRREMGHRVVILDPFGEVNKRYGSLVGQLEQTTCFNPLSIIDPKSPDFSSDVMMLAEAIIIRDPHNPHWTDSATALIAGLIAATIEGSQPGQNFRQASLGQVRKLLMLSDTDLTAAIKVLHDCNPDSFAGRNLQRFAKSTKEVESIRSTAQTQTFPLESIQLIQSMETDRNAFDFAELATGHVDVFLVLPVDRLLTFGRWLRLMVTLAIRAITRAPRPPSTPVLFMLDELGTINPGGGLRMVEQAYGLMRGQGIRIWGFLQDLKQLQHDYPNSWETFIANCEFIQLLFVNDMTTAEYFSRYIGQKPAYRTVYGQTNVGMRPTTAAGNPIYEEQTITSNTGGGSWKSKVLVGYMDQIPIGEEPVGFEPILRPDQLMPLGPKGESLCLFAGGLHFHMRKVNYYKDLRYLGHYRNSPHHAPPAAAPPPRPAPPPPACEPDNLPPWELNRPFDPDDADPSDRLYFDSDDEANPDPWAHDPGLPPLRPVPGSRVAGAARSAPQPASARKPGWIAARWDAASTERKRRASEKAAIEERARHARLIRDAK